MKFKLNLNRRGITKEELISDLQRVQSLDTNNNLTADAYAEKGNFGGTTVLRKFGTWNNALKEANLNVSNRLDITDEELFINIAAVWQKLGRQPLLKEITKVSNFSLFSSGTYEKRFGSWNKALVAFINYIENGQFVEEIKLENKGESKNRTPRNINWRLRATVLIHDNCICKMCGASPAKNADVELHVDHIIPYSKGGETIRENLQTLCSVCNIGKSNVL